MLIKNARIAEMLINHGADINARDNDGKTCLDYVQERIDAGEKDMEIVKKMASS